MDHVLDRNTLVCPVRPRMLEVHDPRTDELVGFQDIFDEAHVGGSGCRGIYEAEVGRQSEREPHPLVPALDVGGMRIYGVGEVDSNELDIYALRFASVSYTHLRAHETRHDLVCRLLLE